MIMVCVLLLFMFTMCHGHVCSSVGILLYDLVLLY